MFLVCSVSSVRCLVSSQNCTFLGLFFFMQWISCIPSMPSNGILILPIHASFLNVYDFPWAMEYSNDIWRWSRVCFQCWMLGPIDLLKNLILILFFDGYCYIVKTKWEFLDAKDFHPSASILNMLYRFVEYRLVFELTFILWS